MIHIRNPVYYRKFRHFSHIQVLLRHIQPYCGILRTLCDSCIFRTLPYSESCHMSNLRYIQNSAKAYSGIFRTLCNVRILRTLKYSELCHIQNYGIFRTRDIQNIQNPVYIDTFRHIQAYSIMIVIIALTFFFFTLI